MLLRLAAKRNDVPSALLLDSRTIQSTPESGGRAGYDGAKKRKGSKVPIAVDTLGHLLGVERHVRQRTRARASRGVGPSRTTRDGQACGTGIRGSRLRGRDSCGGGNRTRHPTRSGQTHRSQTRICGAAQTLGGGTILCLGRKIQTTGPRFMRDSPRLWQDTTGSPSSCSCSNPSSLKVHDRL